MAKAPVSARLLLITLLVFVYTFLTRSPETMLSSFMKVTFTRISLLFIRLFLPCIYTARLLQNNLIPIFLHLNNNFLKLLQNKKYIVTK